MLEQHKPLFSYNILIFPLLAALAVHALLLLIKFEYEPSIQTDQSKLLKVSLYVEETEPPAKKIEKKLSELEPQEKSSDIIEPSLVTKIPDSVISSKPKDKQETTAVSINIDSIKRWSTSEAQKYVDDLEKASLSGLRKGTYEEQLLDPNRVDQRTDYKSNKISTTDGVIHQFKIRGKTRCAMTVHKGDAFNGLDLAPLTGIAKSYNCGDTQKTNVLLNQDGTIKNSDEDDWTITSP